MRALLAFGLSVLTAATLVACTTATPVPATPAAATSTGSASGSVVTASVKVVPAQVAELAFTLSGPVEEIAVKEGDSVAANQALMSIDVPELAYANAAAQAAVNSAEADAYIQSQGRRKWDGFKFVWNSGPPEQLAEARAVVDQAKAALTVAQAQLEQTTLNAPFDGTVVTVSATQGEIVQPNQAVVTIGSLSRLQIETTDLSERNIEAVHIGQSATVRLKAFATPLAGHVTAIAPLAGKSSDGDTVFKVTIELDQQPAGLMWGMTGDVDIQVR